MTTSIFGDQTQHFYTLTPDVIDQALIRLGVKPSGRTFALNSLENRVYEVEIDPIDLPEGPFSSEAVIVKFYRPGRWSEQSILDEHRFLNELAQYEIPVVPPLDFKNRTLFLDEENKLFYAVFPKVRGRLKDELMKEELSQIGRLIARIHNVGPQGQLSHRPQFRPVNYINAHEDFLRQADFLPKGIVNHYVDLALQLSQMITPYFENLEFQRIHGDLHRGNILWTKDGPYVVDFDDAVMGPKEQDLWLLIPGRDEFSLQDREIFLEGYHEMARTPVQVSKLLVEIFRTQRMIHFNGWIARRFEDPSFKKYYSNFDQDAHWEIQMQDLREQWSILQDTLAEY